MCLPGESRARGGREKQGRGDGGAARMKENKRTQEEMTYKEKERTRKEREEIR